METLFTHFMAKIIEKESRFLKSINSTSLSDFASLARFGHEPHKFITIELKHSTSKTIRSSKFV